MNSMCVFIYSVPMSSPTAYCNITKWRHAYSIYVYEYMYNNNCIYMFHIYKKATYNIFAL